VEGIPVLNWVSTTLASGRDSLTETWRILIDNAQQLNFLKNMVLDALYSLSSTGSGSAIGVTSTGVDLTILAPGPLGFVAYEDTFNRSGSGSSSEISALGTWLQITESAVLGNYDLVFRTKFSGALAAEAIFFVSSLTLGMVGAARFSSSLPRLSHDFDTRKFAIAHAQAELAKRENELEVKLANLHKRLKELELVANPMPLAADEGEEYEVVRRVSSRPLTIPAR